MDIIIQSKNLHSGAYIILQANRDFSCEYNLKKYENLNKNTKAQYSETDEDTDPDFEYKNNPLYKNRNVENKLNGDFNRTPNKGIYLKN